MALIAVEFAAEMPEIPKQKNLRDPSVFIRVDQSGAFALSQIRNEIGREFGENSGFERIGRAIAKSRVEMIKPIAYSRVKMDIGQMQRFHDA